MTETRAGPKLGDRTEGSPGLVGWSAGELKGVKPVALCARLMRVKSMDGVMAGLISGDNPT